MTPKILIPSPCSLDSAYNQQCWPEYAAAVREAGANALLVPLQSSEAELEVLCNSAHGILLPGSGADVAPARYGHPTEPETAAADPERERIDTLLLEFAERHGTPTLAVCFGLQSLNVHRGGTLIQHLHPAPVNHRAGRSVSQAHATLIAADSRLGRAVSDAADAQPDREDGYLRLSINSSHHQAVGIPGDGLRITARSTQDGVIEAVEDDRHPFLVGVQWHPERSVHSSDASLRLIHEFVGAARQHA